MHNSSVFLGLLPTISVAQHPEYGKNAQSEYVSFSSADAQQRVHVLYAKPMGPSRGTVLLLHGAAFSADTWNSIGSLDTLSSVGYTTIALDLPGYGKYLSGRERQTQEAKDVFLSDFLGAIRGTALDGGLDKVVVVAASMSGSYANPFVTSQSQRVAAYVTVAAVLDQASLKVSTVPSVPTLIMWGEFDRSFVRRVPFYKALFPLNDEVVIPRAPHPCYLANPKLFHSLIIELLSGSQPPAATTRKLGVRAVFAKRT